MFLGPEAQVSSVYSIGPIVELLFPLIKVV